ncbi:MAG: hemolysin family protein [Candidatus Puniceispirillaceae bacterium]
MSLADLLQKWPFAPKPVSVRDELTGLIESSMQQPDAGFDNQESLLLKNMLGLRDITADDVMVPRADIVAVDIHDGFESVLSQMSEAAHSRYPAYQGTVDETIGMLHIKDMMRHSLSGRKTALKPLIRPVLFVAPSIRLLDLLQEMRIRRMHLALVVDEFGGIDGLITIEDLVEEIVGEIEDEHDETSLPRYELTDDGSLIADARLEVEALEITHGTLISEDERSEIDTLGGLVFALAGRVPACGEVIRHPSGVEFEILEGDPRRVTLIQVRGSDLVVPVPSHSER